MTLKVAGIVAAPAEGPSSSSSGTIIELHQIPFICYFGEKKKKKRKKKKSNKSLCRLTDGLGSQSLDLTGRRGHSHPNPLNYKYIFLRIWMYRWPQVDFHPTVVVPALRWACAWPGSLPTGPQQSSNLFTCMSRWYTEEENEGWIIILSLIWLWKLQQKVNS